MQHVHSTLNSGNVSNIYGYVLIYVVVLYYYIICIFSLFGLIANGVFTVAVTIQ
jgi:hypothetical protein